MNVLVKGFLSLNRTNDWSALKTKKKKLLEFDVPKAGISLLYPKQVSYFSPVMNGSKLSYIATRWWLPSLVVVTAESLKKDVPPCQEVKIFK